MEWLKALDPVGFQTTLFQAFFNLTQEEAEGLDFDRFLKYTIMLKEVLKLHHAPYLKKEDVITDIPT